MAQTGYTPILVYASGTATNVPLAINLTSSALGAELALNYADGKLYYKNSSGTVTLLASAAGSLGDVVGPASATDNALARFDLTTGKLIQNSVGILSDAGALSGITDISASGSITLSGGTANGVAYLNGSKVLTTGSALSYNGSVLGITNTGDGGGKVTNSSTTGSGTWNLTNNSGSIVQLMLYGSAQGAYGAIGSGEASIYSTVSTTLMADSASGVIKFATGGNAEKMRLDTSGNLVVASTSASYSSSGRGNITIGGSSNSMLGFQVGGAAKGYVYHNGTDMFVSNDANGILGFYTNATERARIDSSGNLLVGSSSTIGTGGKFQVTSSADTSIFKCTSSSPYAAIVSNVESTAARLIAFQYGSGGSPTNVGRITTDGTNIAIATVSGITFPATQAASADANTLDDYEEGTWTPGLTSSGAPLSATISSVGRYTKIGNSVVIWGFVSVTAISSATGSYLRVTGLPFSFATTAGAGLEGLTSGSFGPYASFTGLSASDNLIVGASSTTELNIWIASGNGSYGTGASGANLQAGTNFYFSIVGKVA
jgi:hypothetical protein